MYTHGNEGEVIYIIYNRTDSVLEYGKSYRPDFIINRDTTFIVPITGNIILIEGGL